MGTKTFAFVRKNYDFFALTRQNFAQKLHIWSFSVRPCRLLWCPVGRLDGGCGAQAISRKTPIYFIYTGIHATF